jgi:hypothetical protein
LTNRQYEEEEEEEESEGLFIADIFKGSGLFKGFDKKKVIYF